MNTQNVKTLVQQGIQSLRANQLSIAESLFERALQFDPRQADALHLLGLIYGRQSKKK
jgi:Tfp pilus assembly protein PilF